MFLVIMTAMFAIPLQGMHIYWFYLIYQMARALLLESTMDKDIRSEPEFSPHAFEENSITDDSQLTVESSQQSVVSQFPMPPPGVQYPMDPGPSTSHVHRKKVY